jgi:hypothetical protein
MRVGMLARRVIVGELHANFVADALAPEIPVEGQAPKHTKKWPRGAAKVPEHVDVTSLGMPRFSVRSISGLAGPRHSFVIARRSGGIRGEFGSV